MAENYTHGAAAPILSTRAYAFCSYNPEHDCLFSVRPGVPADDALNMASCFLDVARSNVRQLGADGAGASAYAADHMITQAKALIDALELGAAESEPAMPSGVDRRQRDLIERIALLFREGALVANPLASDAAAKDAKHFLEWAVREAKGGAA